MAGSGAVASLAKAAGGALLALLVAVSVGHVLLIRQEQREQVGAPEQALQTVAEKGDPAVIEVPLADEASAEVELPRLPAVPRTRAARVWAAEELALHKGEDRSRPLLLCILGEVYDVGTGERFYAPGHGYAGLMGSDRSRAFADTSTDESEDSMSKVEDLPGDELHGIFGWHQFYRNHETYRFVGVLHGRYFDASGEPTEENLRVQSLQAAQAQSDDYQKKLRKRFMSCNTRMKGGHSTFEVWCDDNYHRPGSVPLHLYWKRPGTPDDEPRGWCACLPPSERAKADADAAASAGQFRLVDYLECAGKQRCHRPQGAPLP